MDFDTIRPILSGTIGGLIAVWISTKSHKWLPANYNNKSHAELLREHRASRYAAVTVFFGGLFGGVLAYALGYFEQNDPTGLAIFFGIAFGAPLFLIPGIALLSSKSPWEALAAYAISESLPPALHRVIAIVALSGLFWGIAKLL